MILWYAMMTPMEPTVDKRIKMSKYKQVYNEIKTQINNGNLAPLQELPSENELMQSYGFSKDTIRKALSLLEIDGYIQKQTRPKFDCYLNMIYLNHRCFLKLKPSAN